MTKKETYREFSDIDGIKFANTFEVRQNLANYLKHEINQGPILITYNGSARAFLISVKDGDLLPRNGIARKENEQLDRQIDEIDEIHEEPTFFPCEVNKLNPAKSCTFGLDGPDKSVRRVVVTAGGHTYPAINVCHRHLGSLQQNVAVEDKGEPQ